MGVSRRRITCYSFTRLLLLLNATTTCQCFLLHSEHGTTSRSSIEQPAGTTRCTAGVSRRRSADEVNSVVLFGLKKSKLGEIAAEDASSNKASMGFRNVKRSLARKSEKEATNLQISPELAKWAASEKVSDRRGKQAERKQQDDALRQEISQVIERLQTLVQQGNKRDMDKILDAIQQLIQASSTPGAASLRFVVNGPTRRDYRTAWAGSEDAICYIGTGLQKVPLARLQEVFLTLGRKSVETIEVLRILGPFPNIRNTLTGRTKIVDANDGATATRSSNTIRIVYDRMVDGLGKEISAGKSVNERTIDLDVLHASELAIVCRPSTLDSPTEDDPLANQGSSLLVLFAEPDLSAQLEMLRVA